MVTTNDHAHSLEEIKNNVSNDFGMIEEKLCCKERPKNPLLNESPTMLPPLENLSHPSNERERPMRTRLIEAMRKVSFKVIENNRPMNNLPVAIATPVYEDSYNSDGNNSVRSEDITSLSLNKKKEKKSLSTINIRTMAFFCFTLILFITMASFLVRIFLFAEPRTINPLNAPSIAPSKISKVSLKHDSNDQKSQSTIHPSKIPTLSPSKVTTKVLPTHDSNKQKSQSTMHPSKMPTFSPFKVTAMSPSKKIRSEREDRGRYPYMVTLIDNSSGQFCGGALIDSTWVLSSANCAGYATHVQIGRYDLSDSSEEFEKIKVEKEYIHPDFDMFNSRHDLMMMKLKSPSSYSPVSFYMGETNSLDGEEVSVMGWGMTSPLVGSLSNVLKEIKTDVISNSQCADAFSSLGIDISSDMICAFRSGKQACQGDGGGPMVLKGNDASSDSLVGLVSWGIGCSSQYPDVYARIDFDFVRDVKGLSTVSFPTKLRCQDDREVEFVLQLHTDNYGYETSWSLSISRTGLSNHTFTVISGGDDGYKSNRVYDLSYCIPVGNTYTFTIEDSASDGICCTVGQGSYKGFVEDELVFSGGSFFDSESKTFTVKER